MTIASETNRAGPYSCNGVTTSFPYGFKLTDASHVRVVLADANGAETVLTLGTHYTVSGVGNANGGSVTTTSAYPTGKTITNLLHIPFTQETDLENQGAYYAEVVEAALDLAVQRDLQLSEQLARALKVSASTPSAADVTVQLSEAVTVLADKVDDIVIVAGVADEVSEVAGISEAVQILAGAAPVLSGTASGIRLDESVFVGDGVNTSWVLPRAPGVEENVILWVDGVVQNVADYSVNEDILIIDPPVDNAASCRALILTSVTANEIEEMVVEVEELINQAQHDSAYVYSSKVDAQSKTIPPSTTAILLKGYAAESDGAGGQWTSDPGSGSGDTFTTNGGARTWYRVRDISRSRFVSAALSDVTPQEYNPLAGSSFSVDATGALQSSIDAAYAAGKHVFLSRGSYGITGPIVMKPGVDLIGDGAVIKQTVTGQDMVRNFVAGGSYSGRTAFGYWKISGIVFDGNAVALSSSSSMFNLCQAVGVTLDRCTFRNVRGGHIFDLAGMKDVLFSNCAFQTHTPLAPNLFKEVIQIDICSAVGFPYGLDASSYDSAPCDGVTVRECTFANTGRPIGSHGWSLTGYADYWHTRINIENIVIRGCSYDAVGAQRWKNFRWSGIDCDGSSGSSICFLRIDDCTDFNVSRCRGVGTFNGRGVLVSKSSYTASVDNWELVDVLVDGVTSSHGFDIYQVTDGRIVRPRVRGVTNGTGINVSGCTRVEVIDPDVYGAATVAASLFVFSSSIQCRVDGGRGRGAYTNAVVVNGGSDCVVADVTISDLTTGRTGALFGSSATRPGIRNCRLIGDGGTGISFSGSVVGGWANDNDLRAMTAGTKLSLAGTLPLNTNNQV